MRRFILTLCLSLIVLAMVVGTQAAEQGKSKAKAAAKKPAEAAEKSEPAKEKAKPAAKKPEEKPAEKKAEEAAKPEAKPAAKPSPTARPSTPPKPTTHTVKAGLLKIDVSLKGNFEPQSMKEVLIRPKAWSTFKVLKAVKHGAEVEQGDVLVELEMEDIDEAIADQKAKLELAEVALEQAEETLKILEETTPLDLAAAERSKRHNDEDYKRFLKIDLPQTKKIANYNVEYSENYLEYQLEELRQLEKMYKADDLTEETEEIVLKRARDAVKRARFYLELDKIQRDETLEVRLPRLEESMKLGTVRQGLSLQQTNATLPLALRRSQLDLAKLKTQIRKDKEKLGELEGDRAMMEIKAPTDGIVYYGEFKRGEWSGASTLADKLVPNGSITASSVFMTIVKSRPMVLRVKVAEKQIHLFRRGLRGTVQPTGYPDMRLPATVSKIDAVPFTAGSFYALLRVAVPEEAEELVPGMSCTAKFTPYLKRRTLIVPPSAVHTDELDDQKHFVMLVPEEGKPKKQSVTIGKKTEDKVEILDGLVAGDKVLKEYPKDKD
jgi:multidrug resistance efflux pump